MIHLDTTILVDLLRESRSGPRPTSSDPGSPGPAHRFLSRNASEQLGLSVFVLSELLAGAASAKEPERERAAIESLVAGLTTVYPDARFAPTYGELFAELRRRGQAIPAFDLLIGTAARVDDAPLVTRNAADFERIPGLLVLSY